MVEPLLLNMKLLIIRFAALQPTGQADCEAAKNQTFFGLPTWFKYLEYKYDVNVKDCRVILDINNNPEKLTLIGFAFIEILLRLVGIVAVGFVIYGGIQYVISQGEPDAVVRAKSTIMNALIGLGIAMSASVLVAFIAGKLT